MKLTLPPGPFKAYLFDCDGTLADSMPLHFVAWSKILGQHNCPFPEEQFYAWGGRPIAEIIAQLNADHGLDMPIDDIVKFKEDHYMALRSELQGIPEVVEHVHDQHGRIPLAVVSGSTRASVTFSLETLGLLDRFDTLVCAEDYTHGKPDPEPFLLAAERLQIPPADCLVFEDTQMGIDSAIAAGMSWVRVPQYRDR